MNEKVEKVEQTEGTTEQEQSSIISMLSGKKAMFVYQMIGAALFLGLIALVSKYFMNGLKLF
jgi:hypothetical protein